MGAGAYLAGCALLGWTSGACALAAARLVRPRGVDGWLGWATVWTGLVALVHLLPLALGLLSRASVALAAGVALAVAWRAGRRTPVGSATDRSAPLGVAARVAAVAIAGFALASLTATAGRPFTGLDALNFQLPQVARWIQTGTLWQLDQYIVDYSNTTYPHTGNLLLLAGTLPWRSTFVAGLVPVPFYAMAAAGAYACGRELGASARAAALAACLLAAVPVLARSGLMGAMSDAPMLAWLAAGVLFLLRHARTGGREDLALAGLGLGLAFGTKWYAVPAVALIVAAWALVRRRPREAGALAAIVAAAGGFWLLRNAVLTGNPLFPQPLLGLFPAPPDPLRELAGFSLAHYALDLEVWNDYLRPVFAVFLGPPGLGLLLGALAAAGLAGRRREARIAVVGVTSAGLAILYVVTPYSALGLEGEPVGAGVSTRYGLPALLGGAMLTGWALDGLRGRTRAGVELLLVLAVLDGLRRAFSGLAGADVLVGCAVAGGAMLVAARRPVRAGRPAVAAFAAVTLLVAALAGDGLRRRANASGYGPAEPALAVLESRSPGGVRVGIAGRWTNEGVSPVLPAFGPRLGNEVAYVGRYVEGMLRGYRDPVPFRAALASGRYGLVVVGRADSGGRPAREEGWARAAGWRTLAASPRLALLAAPGA